MTIRRDAMAVLATILCFFLSAFSSEAQEKAKNNFGKVTAADFNLPASPVIDSNTKAVVLSDIGESHYIGNKFAWYSNVFTRHTRIKILNKSALGLAIVELPLEGEESEVEQISDVAAVTYNLENGRVFATKMDPKDIVQNRLNKTHSLLKFALPGVKEGSIIEYRYTKTSRFWYELPSWSFQWIAAPCLYSEYKIEVPEFMPFALVRQGVHPFAISNASVGNASYRTWMEGNNAIMGANDNSMFLTVITNRRNWVMKDVPGFGDEPYLTTPVNYVDRVDFHIGGHSHKKGETLEHNTTWADATAEMLSSVWFGAPLDQDNARVNELADKITPTDGDRLVRAKAIYYYISHHFTCTASDYRTDPFVEVIDRGNGTVGDINLLLTAVLRRESFDVEPVVLSTREHGFNSAHFAELDRLNYVIVRLHLEGNIYYLDATRPELGFGQLPEDCYNGPARIISNRDSGSVFFEADSLKESETTMVLLSLSDKGLEGAWQSTPGVQGSYAVRRAVDQKGQQEYFKSIRTKYGADTEISNGGIDGLDKPEEPVKIHYDFAMGSTKGSSLIYFSPVFDAGWQRNPFVSEDRKYPVELPYAMDKLYLFTMDIPDGYTVDEIPKPVRVGLDGNQGQFEYLIAQQDGKIQLRCRFRLNKARFSPEEYGHLRDFCAYVVRKEAEQIVLKKK